MTHAELEQHLSTLRRFIQAERHMRCRVFARRPTDLAEKLKEIDDAAQSIKAIVEALKAHMPQQATLLDVPAHTKGY